MNFAARVLLRAGRVLLKIACVVLALVLVGEYVLTLTGWRARGIPALLRERGREIEKSQGSLRFDTTLLFGLKPRFRASKTHRGRQSLGDFSFRGRAPQPSPPGMLEVVLLGDSAVHGVQLFDADTLEACLARALDQRGLPPQRVAVIDFAVPGYTTLQIERLYRQVVARAEAPAAVVVSTAMWNDRAPASGPVSQEDILEAIPAGSLSKVLPAWSARLSWLRFGGNPLRAPASSEDLESAWRRGKPLFGPLIERKSAVRAMVHTIRAALAAGSSTVAIVPAYPALTLLGQHGLSEDVHALRVAYERTAATVIDGPELLAQSGLGDTRAFLDGIHPSGPWNSELADAIATALEEPLKQRSGARVSGGLGVPGGVRVLRVEPASISALGDERVSLTVSGLPPGEIPEVLIGSQPLFDVSRTERGDTLELSGISGADKPGTYDVVLQSTAGVMRVRAGLKRLAPTLAFVRGDAGSFPRVILSSRRGDHLQELWAAHARVDHPTWSLEGNVWLGAGAVRIPVESNFCNAEGRAEVRLDTPLSWPSEDTYLQALVLPEGFEQGAGSGVASALLEVPADPSRAATQPASGENTVSSRRAKAGHD